MTARFLGLRGRNTIPSREAKGKWGARCAGLFNPQTLVERRDAKSPREEKGEESDALSSTSVSSRRLGVSAFNQFLLSETSRRSLHHFNLDRVLHRLDRLHRSFGKLLVLRRRCLNDLLRILWRGCHGSGNLAGLGLLGEGDAVDRRLDHRRLKRLLLDNRGVDLFERRDEGIVEELGGQVDALGKLRRFKFLGFIAPGYFHFRAAGAGDDQGEAIEVLIERDERENAAT